MRKTILLVLMAIMIVTPCMAEEVEPDGIFSLHGTSWKAIIIAPYGVWERGLGFYKGRVYECAREAGISKLGNPAE